VLTVSVKSLSFFPNLETGQKLYNFHHRHTIRETFENHCSPYPLEKGEYTLSPAQFCRLLGAHSEARCRLSMILFPRIEESRIEESRIEETNVPVRMERLSSIKMVSRLDEARLCMSHKNVKSIFSMVDEPSNGCSDRDSYGAAMEQVAERVAGFECGIGSNVYETSQWQDALEKAIQEVGEPCQSPNS